MKKQMIKSLLVIICMLAAGICYSCNLAGTRGEETGPKLVLEQETKSPEDGKEKLTGQEGREEMLNGASAEAKTQLEIEAKLRVYVHVCGKVAKPGVYEMEEGSRVFQAVELAGGLLDEAAVDYLNMAQIVADGMKITVPSKEEVESGTLSGQTAAMGVDSGQGAAAEPVVNLNTADKDQLMTLSGIGEARAEDILRYRAEHGRFRNIEEIMNVPGIKDAAFQKIKDRITV